MTWQSVPLCERCWIEERGEWDIDTLVSVPHPVTVLNSGLEHCDSCGQPTIVGIFVRRDVGS